MSLFILHKFFYGIEVARIEIDFIEHSVTSMGLLSRVLNKPMIAFA